MIVEMKTAWRSGASLISRGACFWVQLNLCCVTRVPRARSHSTRHSAVHHHVLSILVFVCRSPLDVSQTNHQSPITVQLTILRATHVDYYSCMRQGRVSPPFGPPNVRLKAWLGLSTKILAGGVSCLEQGGKRARPSVEQRIRQGTPGLLPSPQSICPTGASWLSFD